MVTKVPRRGKRFFPLPCIWNMEGHIIKFNKLANQYDKEIPGSSLSKVLHYLLNSNRMFDKSYISSTHQVSFVHSLYVATSICQLCVQIT